MREWIRTESSEINPDTHVDIVCDKGRIPMEKNVEIINFENSHALTPKLSSNSLQRIHVKGKPIHMWNNAYIKLRKQIICYKSKKSEIARGDFKINYGYK